MLMATVRSNFLFIIIKFLFCLLYSVFGLSVLNLKYILIGMFNVAINVFRLAEVGELEVQMFNLAQMPRFCKTSVLFDLNLN